MSVHMSMANVSTHRYRPNSVLGSSASTMRHGWQRSTRSTTAQSRACRCAARACARTRTRTHARTHARPHACTRTTARAQLHATHARPHTHEPMPRWQPFGVFVQLDDGCGKGLCHISQIASRHVAEPADECHEGQKVWVKVIDIRPGDKLALSMKVVDQITNAQCHAARHNAVHTAIRHAMHTTQAHAHMQHKHAAHAMHTRNACMCTAMQHNTTQHNAT